MDTANEIVFLMGAGAVKDAGLPLATELTTNVEKGIEEHHPELLKALRYVAGAVQFGKACRGEQWNQPINIEELLVACTFLTERRNSYVYPFVSAWHEQIVALESLPPETGHQTANGSYEFLARFAKAGLREWLAVDNREEVAYLQGLADFTKNGRKLRIFSLNYDEAIECAFEEYLGRVNTAWTNGFNRRGWDSQEYEIEHYSAYLYKLHGSLDWVHDPRLGICSTRWPQAEASEELPSEYNSLLIFGTDAKLQPVDPFLTMLFHFQHYLGMAKLLIVVGYSFGDPHINAMIQEALGSDPQMRCVVVNPSGLNIGKEHLSFRRLVATERFTELALTAKSAFEGSRLVTVANEILGAMEDEAPF